MASVTSSLLSVSIHSSVSFSIPGRGKRFSSYPQRLDRLWGRPASYSTGTVLEGSYFSR
jgi:hypothetical protein